MKSFFDEKVFVEQYRKSQKGRLYREVRLHVGKLTVVVSNILADSDEDAVDRAQAACRIVSDYE